MSQIRWCTPPLLPATGHLVHCVDVIHRLSGEHACWVGEQARLPYALKAGDAKTIGGLPSSAFVLAAPSAGSVATRSPKAASPAATPASLGGSGTADYIPLWTSTSNLGNSVLFQTGTEVGINTATPASRLDVNSGAPCAAR
jgi:hypothetical protein